VAEVGDCAAELQALVDASAAAHHCPSLAWGVVAGGALAVRGGTADAVYRIASMTKSFTAATVLALRDEGLLALDVPVARYAPTLSGITGEAGWPEITLRDLLAMSSGLPEDDPWADRHLDICATDLDRVVRDGVGFASVTGTTYEYSNLGYAMAARVIEQVTGRPVTEHIDRRLLIPLGMASTAWEPPADGWARPHRVEHGAPVPDAPPLGTGGFAAMGGLWSTVADLARWIAWFDAAVTSPDEAEWTGLSPASRREMQRIHTYAGVDTVGGRTAPQGYGFGLEIIDDRDLGTVVGHSGGLPGYGANMRWLSGRGVGAVALANTTYAPMWDLTMEMLVALHAAGAVPERTVTVSPALQRAAERLVALLDAWDDRAAAALFADNVALDEPFERRRVAAAKLGGTLQLVGIEAATARRGTILAAAGGVPVRIELSLAPLAGDPIQRYEVSVEA
jgi:CubicO group peptidase (beta-lactamase class C family)